MTKKFVKAALIASCALVLMFATIAGTIAYLTSQTETISNTFTSGKVAIELADKVGTNTYKLLPGKTYDDKPVVTVLADSEDCYLFVKVVNNIADLEESGDTTIAKQLENNHWILLDGYTDVYYLDNKVSSKNENQDFVVFESFKIKASAKASDFNDIANDRIEITAYAVQADADGFDTAAKAWAATFGAQANQ